MTSAPPLAILFESEQAANSNVAGIPAAARAIFHAQSLAKDPDDGPAILVVPNGWNPSALCRSEIARLAPDANWDHGDIATAARWISGEQLQRPATQDNFSFTRDWAAVRPATCLGLQNEARQIILSTGKPGDGIVSRHLNRPVSQAVTRILLHWPGVRPWHATLAAGLIGIVMLAALLTGQGPGLLAGAILFQAASVIDGVDGEIARATFRSSRRGAMLDTLTDAATNLGFIGGVSYNLLLSGQINAAKAGAIGFLAIATGSILLGLNARRDTDGFSFDTMKVRLRERPSFLRQMLIWIASRDFYALAACFAILAGGAALVLFAFGIVASGWLIALVWMLYFRPKGKSGSGSV